MPSFGKYTAAFTIANCTWRSRSGAIESNQIFTFSAIGLGRSRVPAMLEDDAAVNCCSDRIAWAGAAGSSRAPQTASGTRAARTRQPYAAPREAGARRPPPRGGVTDAPLPDQQRPSWCSHGSGMSHGRCGRSLHGGSGR